MVGDGSFGEVQRPRDLRIRRPARKMREDILLAAGQAGGIRERAAARAARRSQATP